MEGKSKTATKENETPVSFADDLLLLCCVTSFIRLLNLHVLYVHISFLTS